MRYAIWNQFLAVEVEEVAAPRDEAEVCARVELARRQGKHIKAVGVRVGRARLRSKRSKDSKI